jgi:hypothetical protein
MRASFPLDRTMPHTTAHNVESNAPFGATLGLFAEVPANTSPEDVG